MAYTNLNVKIQIIKVAITCKKTESMFYPQIKSYKLLKKVFGGHFGLFPWSKLCNVTFVEILITIAKKNPKRNHDFGKKMFCQICPLCS